MSRTPDQDRIDALVRKLRGEDSPSDDRTNDHGGGGTSALTNDAVLEKMFAERKRGNVWRDLYEGRWEDHYPSRSEAVAAFLRKAGFYSNNDRSQMEELTRSCGLASPKFDERRGGSTWLQNEIDKAIVDTSETYAPANKVVGTPISSPSSPPNPNTGGGSDDTRLRVINARAFPKDWSPRPCVVDRIVPERHITTFYGAAGTTKSILILSLLLAAARGDKTWLCLAMGGQYKCLFIDFELDLAAQAQRARQLVAGVGEDELPEHFNYLAAAGKDPREVFELAYKFCKEHKIGLLAIDSVGLAMTGDAGAYRDVVDFFQKTLDRFRVNLGCTVVLIDHQANLQAGESYQAKGAFGSSYKGNLSRSRVQVQQQEATKGVRRVTLRHNKANFTDYADPFDVEVRFEAGRIELEAVGMEAGGLAQELTLPAWKRALLALDASGEPMDRTEIATAASITYGTAGNALSKLRRDGCIKDCEIVEGGKKPVVLTDEGKRFVEKFLSEYRDGVITSPPPYRGDDSDDNEDLSEEEAREVKKLISEGMSPAFARAAVLGEEA